MTARESSPASGGVLMGPAFIGALRSTYGDGAGAGAVPGAVGGLVAGWLSWP